MAYIGIITGEKNIDRILFNLEKIFDIDKIIYITEKNIDKLQNIRFEAIVIDKALEEKNKLKKIILNSNCLILNTDIEIDKRILENENLMIITYGFRNKATFTVSSVSENNIIICLQRIMKTAQNGKYEPQEIIAKNEQNLENHEIIYLNILKLLYQNDKEKVLK